jgi:undecaprenyl-diphosphatase
MKFYIILMNLISLSCEPYILIACIIMLYKYRYININQIVVFVIGFCVVMSLKLNIKSPRPYVLNKNVINHSIIRVDDYMSFPSGHSYCAFMLFFILYNNMFSIKYAIIPILIGISRIVLNVHYPRDVIGGFLIALLNYNLLL